MKFSSVGGLGSMQDESLDPNDITIFNVIPIAGPGTMIQQSPKINYLLHINSSTIGGGNSKVESRSILGYPSCSTW